MSRLQALIKLKLVGLNIILNTIEVNSDGIQLHSNNGVTVTNSTAD